MKTITFILFIALIPRLSFAVTTWSSMYTSGVQYNYDQEDGLDDWMLDIKSWSTEVDSDLESEKEISFENWMIDVSDIFWYTEVGNKEIRIEDSIFISDLDSCEFYRYEQEPEVESWMVNPSSWLRI